MTQKQISIIRKIWWIFIKSALFLWMDCFKTCCFTPIPIVLYCDSILEFLIPNSGLRNFLSIKLVMEQTYFPMNFRFWLAKFPTLSLKKAKKF